MKQTTFAFALIVIFLLSCSEVHAQTIQLHFPHFAAHQYDWKIFQGKKQITVSSGEIAPDSRVTLVMPEGYATNKCEGPWCSHEPVKGSPERKPGILIQLYCNDRHSPGIKLK